MAIKPELAKRIEIIEKAINDSKFDPKEHKDKTRSTIALFVVKGYFYLIGIVLVGIPIYNLYVISPDLILSIKDMISVISGSMSGIFGFVVGYYFKGTEND